MRVGADSSYCTVVSSLTRSSDAGGTVSGAVFTWGNDDGTARVIIDYVDRAKEASFHHVRQTDTEHFTFLFQSYYHRRTRIIVKVTGTVQG